MAVHRRRVFAASVVVTIAACGGSPKEPNAPKRTGFHGTWSVSMIAGNCEAHEPMGDCPRGAMCNPPPPRVIACPADAIESQRLEVGQLADGTCAIIPEGCESAACAVTKTACPLAMGEELPVLSWDVKRGENYECTASWTVRGSPRTMPVACPFASAVPFAQITRADAAAPCTAKASGEKTTEVPCPAPPAP